MYGIFNRVEKGWLLRDWRKAANCYCGDPHDPNVAKFKSVEAAEEFNVVRIQSEEVREIPGYTAPVDDSEIQMYIMINKYSHMAIVLSSREELVEEIKIRVHDEGDVDGWNVYQAQPVTVNTSTTVTVEIR